MSWTPSVGVYPPRYWIYVAGVVNEWLQKVLQKGEITVDFLPTNIYKEAKQFLFTAARRATGDPSFDHTEAQLDRLVLSQELLMAAQIPTPNGALPIMHLFCSFFETLNTPRDLWGEERALCSDMVKFFLALTQEGDLRPHETMQEYHERRLQHATRLSARFMHGMMPQG